MLKFVASKHTHKHVQGPKKVCPWPFIGEQASSHSWKNLTPNAQVSLSIFVFPAVLYLNQLARWCHTKVFEHSCLDDVTLKHSWLDDIALNSKSCVITKQICFILITNQSTLMFIESWILTVSCNESEAPLGFMLTKGLHVNFARDSTDSMNT